MDIFIGYTPEDEFELLKATLEAWSECDGAEPKAIFIKKKSQFELYRRLTADRLSEEKFYILADLGCIPVSNDLVRTARAKVTDDIAMMGMKSRDCDVQNVPKGVRICQKNVISHWFPKETEDYDWEHMASALRTGKRVEIDEELTFKHLGAS